MYAIRSYYALGADECLVEVRFPVWDAARLGTGFQNAKGLPPAGTVGGSERPDDARKSYNFV